MLSRLRDHLPLGVGRLASLLVDLVANLLLTRALGPGPFGLVAMAATVMTILQTLGDAGVGQSLLTDRAGGARRTGAALLLSGALGLAVTLASLALTPLVLRLYPDHPEVLGPWLVACGLAVPSILLNVPLSLAQRAERFELLAGSRLAATLVASLVALALARTHHDAWPLLARQVLAIALQLAICWLVLRPAVARPTRADVEEVRAFASGFVGFQVLNALQRNAHGPLLGRWLGDAALGQYGLASRVLMLPIEQVGGLLSTVAYPRIARLAPDGPAVAAAISTLMREVATLTTPVCLGVAVAAPELVSVLFGPAWAPAVLPCRILSLLCAWQAPARYTGLAFTVSRDTAAMARWEVISAPLGVLGLSLGLLADRSATGAATGYALASLLLAVPQVEAAARILGVPASLLARGAISGIARGAAATAPLLVACALCRELGAQPALTLGAVIGVGALSELALLRAWLRPPASR